MAASNLLWLLVMLSLCLEDVKSQWFPYVSFSGQTLDNHSYVDISLVGDDSSGSDSVQCITDLNICCTGILILRVLIVETGISLMELDWDSVFTMISLRVVDLRELLYVVVTIPPHQSV